MPVPIHERVYINSCQRAYLLLAAYGLGLAAQLFTEHQKFSAAATSTYSLAANTGDFVPVDVFDSWAHQLSAAWRSFVTKGFSYQLCWPRSGDLVPLVAWGAMVLQNDQMSAADADVASAIERAAFDLLRHSYGGRSDRAWRVARRLDRLLFRAAQWHGSICGLDKETPGNSLFYLRKMPRL